MKDTELYKQIKMIDEYFESRRYINNTEPSFIAFLVSLITSLIVSYYLNK